MKILSALVLFGLFACSSNPNAGSLTGAGSPSPENSGGSSTPTNPPITDNDGDDGGETNTELPTPVVVDGGASDAVSDVVVVDASDAATVADAAPAAAPSWSSLFNEYLVGGTIGNCTPCHLQMTDASGAYNWLSEKGALTKIAVQGQSRLSWLGGDMPPGGPSSNAQASADFAAWAAAGAPND